MQNMIPFPINTYSTDPTLDGLQGQLFEYRGLKLMLVKAAAALTSPGGKFLAFDDSSEDAATVSATFAEPTDDPGVVAGLCPAYLSGNVTSNAYLFVIRGGKENNAEHLNSVVNFSSAQTSAAGINVNVISGGVCGVVQISSTVQQGRRVAVLRQLASSSAWLTTAGSYCGEVEVMLAC